MILFIHLTQLFIFFILFDLLVCSAKQSKRMLTKATFVGPGFTRKPQKYERFSRPTRLRFFTKAHVTHPELKCTSNLDIIGIKKNPKPLFGWGLRDYPQTPSKIAKGSTYTCPGVITKGTIIEVKL
uniref:Uncharacterized protein n=1 Tax=Ananas comosus var. bracteatus TaxID=296719 RepID=A0A6V7QXT4_ANACO